jgi:hypothetical protein
LSLPHAVVSAYTGDDRAWDAFVVGVAASPPVKLILGRFRHLTTRSLSRSAARPSLVLTAT